MVLAATTWVTDYAAIIEDHHSSSSSGFAWLQAGDERGNPRACTSREAVRCYSEARSQVQVPNRHQLQPKVFCLKSQERNLWATPVTKDIREGSLCGGEPVYWPAPSVFLGEAGTAITHFTGENMGHGF